LPAELPEVARQWLDRQQVASWDPSGNVQEQLQVECRYDEHQRLQLTLQASRGQLVVQVRDLPAELRAWFGQVRDDLAQALKRLGFDQVDYQLGARDSGQESSRQQARERHARHEPKVPLPFPPPVALGSN